MKAGPAVKAGPPARAAGAASAASAAGAVGLLAAACVAWSAIPLSGTGGVGALVLAVAVTCAVLDAARVALGDSPGEPLVYLNPVRRAAAVLTGLVRRVPWAEALVVAVLVLEALHRSRPWHTGLLGVALVAYLFAVHLAESRGRPGVLRPQAPVLAAGLGLLVLAVAAAMLPAGTGNAASLMTVLAALAAVAAFGLALQP